MQETTAMRLLSAYSIEESEVLIVVWIPSCFLVQLELSREEG